MVQVDRSVHWNRYEHNRIWTIDVQSPVVLYFGSDRILKVTSGVELRRRSVCVCDSQCACKCSVSVCQVTVSDLIFTHQCTTLEFRDVW